MIEEGNIVLFRFPQADLVSGKLRPALLLKKIPNDYRAWLVCMISTQLHQKIDGLEVSLSTSDAAFSTTGLKKDSLVRSSRLAVVDESIFEGKLGSVRLEKLQEIRRRLSSWVESKEIVT